MCDEEFYERGYLFVCIFLFRDAWFKLQKKKYQQILQIISIMYYVVCCERKKQWKNLLCFNIVMIKGITLFLCWKSSITLLESHATIIKITTT